MVGLPCLDEPLAGLFPASCPASHLLKKLERAFGGAGIAAGKADISIDDAHQGQKRKVMSFGYKLGAYDDVATPVCDLVQFATHAFRAAREVGRKNQCPGLRKELGRFFRQALDTGAACRERVNLVAFRACVRAALDMATMVAH